MGDIKDALAWHESKLTELEKRVKALEDQRHTLLNALTAEPALKIDYTQAFTVGPEKVTLFDPKPAPAPDLETVIDNAISRFKTVRWEIAGGLDGPKFRDLLRAFAAELGVK